MPHKHKRHSDDKSFFDLPPTAPRARPLPTGKSRENAPKSKLKRKRSGAWDDDDTPKSFARLMRFHTGEAKLPKGLDDGVRKPKEKKRKQGGDGNANVNRNGNGKVTDEKTPKSATNATTDEKLIPTVQPLKIFPGERLGDFAARVDQALPLSSLASMMSKKDSRPLDPAIKGLVKERPTKHNKRLARMQKEWREEEARRKEKKEEAEDEGEEKREEEGLLWDGVGQSTGRKWNKKKKNTSAMAGLQGDNEDPWAELSRTKREKTKQRNLQDVVQAPPVLDVSKARGKGRIFREVQAVVAVENVPGKVGSLRKREEMAGVRKGVIDGMRERRREKGGVWDDERD